MTITRMTPEKSDAAVIRDTTDLKQWLEKRAPAKRRGDGTRGLIVSIVSKEAMPTTRNPRGLPS